MKNKIGILLTSAAITIGFEAILVILMYVFAESPGQNSGIIRVLTMLGGDLPMGIIQTFTVFLFVYGLFEIRGQFQIIKNEERAYKHNLLPEKENWIVAPEDVTIIRLQAVEIEKREKFFLTDLIKKACNKYRSDKSPADALAIVSEQVKLNIQEAESNQSLIRYIAWAIPSVGFIGTVIGIANSLGLAHTVVERGNEGIKGITSALSVAFDTTLVALVLSLVLMYFFHNLQEKIEKLHTRMEGYVIENLINRMYHS